MRRDPDRILGHAEDNDGIEEYDNQLPDWWLGLFGFTVLWAVGYAVDYHLVSHRSQVGSYLAEMADAKERWPETAPGPLVLDDASVAAGAQIFATTCAACHGAELTGGIGPSLVDATWIHGGDPEQIRATITNGVPEKGMPTWGPLLGADKIAKVAAFVVTRPRVEGAAVVAAASAGDETGEQIYAANCVPCHGPDLEGKVGPSLVDAEWIHGGTLDDIVRTITVGVPEKGMVTWGPVLGDEKIGRVARFVQSRGTGTATR